ncbi:MAG TPA: hypothetical protein VK679_16300 [Gemmatimonadaceae bacterium]|jgi:hypothetical protein|nr:hypothetical protein [Gemmatimonadaceae bacterium]
MRKQNTLVFDDFVYATAADLVWTDAKYNDLLGRFDQTSIFAVADSVSGTNPTLFVQIEQSGDGRNWKAKNSSPEINGTAITANATTPVQGNDAGSAPSASFVRLTVYLGGTGTPTAHIKIYVCNRDQA